MLPNVVREESLPHSSFPECESEFKGASKSKFICSLRNRVTFKVTPKRVTSSLNVSIDTFTNDNVRTRENVVLLQALQVWLRPELAAATCMHLAQLACGRGAAAVYCQHERQHSRGSAIRRCAAREPLTSQRGAVTNADGTTDWHSDEHENGDAHLDLVSRC